LTALEEVCDDVWCCGYDLCATTGS
jgi:hypothetical protein